MCGFAISVSVFLTRVSTNVSLLSLSPSFSRSPFGSPHYENPSTDFFLKAIINLNQAKNVFWLFRKSSIELNREFGEEDLRLKTALTGSPLISLAFRAISLALLHSLSVSLSLFIFLYLSVSLHPSVYLFQSFSVSHFPPFLSFS